MNEHIKIGREKEVPPLVFSFEIKKYKKATKEKKYLTSILLNGNKKDEDASKLFSQF